jgi:hypothetical protein
MSERSDEVVQPTVSERSASNGEDETPLERFLAGVAELPDSMPFLE